MAAITLATTCMAVKSHATTGAHVRHGGDAVVRADRGGVAALAVVVGPNPGPTSATTSAGATSHVDATRGGVAGLALGVRSGGESSGGPHPSSATVETAKGGHVTVSADRGGMAALAGVVDAPVGMGGGAAVPTPPQHVLGMDKHAFVSCLVGGGGLSEAEGRALAATGVQGRDAEDMEYVLGAMRGGGMSGSAVAAVERVFRGGKWPGVEEV